MWSHGQDLQHNAFTQPTQETWKISFTSHFTGSYIGSEFLEEFSIVTQNQGQPAAVSQEVGQVAKVNGLKSSHAQLCSTWDQALGA